MRLLIVGERNMRNSIRRHLSVGLVCGAALLAWPAAPQAGQQPPPIQGVTGTIALEGTIDETSKAGKAVIVKTVDGVRHLFHLTEKTTVHGRAAAADDLRGIDAGSRIVVHYTAAGAERIALEVDRLDAEGLKTVEGVVSRVDRITREMTIRLEDGTTQTLRLTERAASDVGRDVDSAADDAARVIVYYADEAGQQVAHYFKRVP
jgi:hypothetical protein